MMKISVIVPAYNGGDQLHRCLQGIAASQRPPDQVIVVDDGSTDGSVARVPDFGFQLLTLPDGPRGPARARNRGAMKASQADVLVFVDADVMIQVDTLSRIEKHLLDAPDVAALFGSYDNDPAAREVVSLYKNLLHHYVHQVSRREASTFWAGCGAVRRAAFHAVGGFDEAHTRPSIEDIELGVRMRKAGYRIRLCPDVQVKHLKRWTLGTLICGDIRDRAFPWSRLLLREGRLLNDLNLTMRNRVIAAASVVLVLSGIAVWWLPKSAGLLAVLATVTFITLNFDLLRLFGRQGGAVFAVMAAGLHLLYYLYSTATFVWVMCREATARAWNRLNRQPESVS